MLPESLKLWCRIKHNELLRGYPWVKSVVSLLNPSLPPTSASFLQSLPPQGPVKICNPYVPLGRTRVFRDLMQDKSIVLPSERDDFERLMLSMQKKLTLQLRLLERELTLLFEPASLRDSSDKPEEVLSSDSEGSQFQRLVSGEKKDREFWLLRRLGQLANVAGFVDVSREQLEHAFGARCIERESASYFIDPKDYDIVRFWVRGIRPYYADPSLKDSRKRIHPVPARSPLTVIKCLLSNPRDEFRNMFHQLRTVTPSPDATCNNASRDYLVRRYCFTNVLMAVRGVNDEELLLRLYDFTPAASPSRSTYHTDSLSLFLPTVHFRPLTVWGRTLIAASCATALSCLGVVAPFAWLFLSNSDAILAWSVATAATAGLTSSLVLSQFWCSRSKTNSYMRDLQFHCIRNSGIHSAQNVLKMAIEEELKAAILTYALLLRPSEAGKPINASTLSTRAVSWISKRLSPKPPSVDADIVAGVGPLSDITINVDRSLELLRRLGLVQGSKDDPRAVPVSTAATMLESDRSGPGLSPIWVVDPVYGEEINTNWPE